MEVKQLTFRDGSTNQAQLFPAEGKAKAIVICLPAMGVRASYYKDFAQSLAQMGFHAITIDWRGHGHSNLSASRTTDFGYEELVGDLYELQEYAQQWCSVMDVYIAGHSLGGQIGSLCAARYPGYIQGLILIASCSVHYEGWEGAGAWRVWLPAKLFHPLSKLLGYFPGEFIGFGGREAQRVMHDWCYNGLYGKYRLATSLFDYEAALRRMETPSLAIGVKGDKMAPRQAIANLYQKFAPLPQRPHLELASPPAELENYDHFNWAKHPAEVVAAISDWVESLAK